jgi:hypothetical protein
MESEKLPSFSLRSEMESEKLPSFSLRSELKRTKSEKLPPLSLRSETEAEFFRFDGKKCFFAFEAKRKCNEAKTKRKRSETKNFGSQTKRKYALLISLWSEAKNSKRKEAKKNIFLCCKQKWKTEVCFPWSANDNGIQ